MYAMIILLLLIISFAIIFAQVFTLKDIFTRNIDMTQNFIHKIGPFPYYKTPSTYNNPYFQIGSYNPFSLY